VAVQAPSTKPPPAATQAWTTLQTFKGGGNQQTDMFFIPPGDVSVVWHLTGDTSAFLEGSDGFPYILVQPTPGTPLDGETRVYLDPGDYYLSVENFGRWRFVIRRR
jgi:hypothetical protein